VQNHSSLPPIDAILLVSFGGPEGREDVLPFLENVVRGKPVPRERLLEVAEHYYQFDGISPINEQNRALIAALVQRLRDNDCNLPVYWGNRNWHPLLPDALRQMANDGVHHALAFVTSAFSCYSGCRQYREDIQRAQETVGAPPPHVSKLRVFFNHPAFVEAVVDRTREALTRLPPEHRHDVEVLFTAHSLPVGMASGSDYEQQLREASRLVANALEVDRWRVVYQSRSGPPQQPWLEPDICDVLEELGQSRDKRAVVVVPIGFVSDHMEVIYDLDHEAQEVCDRLDIPMARAATVGTHPQFVEMIVDLIEELLHADRTPKVVGKLPPRPPVCPADCCPYQR